jgi:hypothetical protein
MLRRHDGDIEALLDKIGLLEAQQLQHRDALVQIQATPFGPEYVQRLASVEAAAASQREDTVSTQVLKETMLDMETRMTAQAARSPPRATGSSSGEVPYELRVQARVGNLGWDDVQDVLRKRCDEFLSSLDLPAGSYLEPSAPHRGGSFCDVEFTSPVLLQRAKQLAYNKKKVVRTDTAVGHKAIWLDARKTRVEMKPARLTHRAHEFIQGILAEKTPVVTPVKDLMGKRVSVAGAVVCFTATGQLRTTQALALHLTAEEISQLKGWAESS